MSEIRTYPFNREGIESIRKYKYGRSWPVVYILEGDKELYVGESISAYARAKQHLDNEQKRRLNKIHIISDDEYNKSATLDTESSLIEYLVADNKFTLQNSNGGLQNHNYFDREKYIGKFELLWKDLQGERIANKDLLQIRNSDIFKYSPYKTLTDDQYLISEEIIARLKRVLGETYLIHGGPGTGKTILATYLIKRLVEEGRDNVALVIAMGSLRSTLKKVFKNISGLSAGMVISPSEATRKKYDVLLVDEAHRLRKRVNITNYKSFDDINNKLGLGQGGTELDWVLRSANSLILFFDEKQSVRPSDIHADKIHALDVVDFTLRTQVRVKGGEDYLDFIDSLLEVEKGTEPNFSDYDFRIYDDLSQMIEEIKAKEEEHKLCRLVAGYAWEWKSRKDKDKPDIVIGKNKLFWNSVTSNWVNSPNAINEVGCIHTIQGYDLNYAGVIIGPEISFNKRKQQIEIDRDRYFDANGKRSVTNDEELKRYIINIYKTLLTRGIRGTYVYIVDPELRDYFHNATTREKLDSSSS